MKTLTFFLLTILCITSLSAQENFDPLLYLDKPIPQARETVVVGTYGGWWGLHGWFIPLLDDYFTVEQMQEIDIQIQESAGVIDMDYNYTYDNTEAEAYDVYYEVENDGYVYDNSTDTWEYYTGSAQSKFYDELADTAFVIDIETATLVSQITATEFGGTAATDNYSFNQAFTNSAYVTGSENYTGDDLEIDGETYKVLAARNYSPIIIDLNGNGKPDVTKYIWTPHAPAFFKERTAVFDMTGDGRPEYVEWLNVHDGLLAMPSKDGNISGALNLFGTAGGYKDGYEKMAVILDQDNNGWVEGNELVGLVVWTDKNGDAKAQQGEMTSVEDLGIQKISTAHKNFASTCMMNDKEVKTWDWWPSGYELMKVK